MRVVITGGGGFLGKRLAKEILARGTLTGPSGVAERIEELVLFDAAAPSPAFEDRRVTAVIGDIAESSDARALITAGTASVFHLAAVVSAGAEADFDLGYRVNLDGTRNLLEACRAQPRPVRFVFASSVATYGGDIPETVTDATPQTPETSYGAQKTIGELLVNDYSRKGYLDGRSLRLPTITVRPGKPNKAASGWASSIMREPLQGQDVTIPVSPETRMACLSPRRVIAAFIRAHELPAASLGRWRSVVLPGISVAAKDMAAAVQRHAGNRKIGRIHWEADAAIQKINDGWPKATASERARRLGFEGDTGIDEIVKGFIEDELEGAPR
ncbi:MAG TPA: D-erythronate dehydrogenase [Candidatus Cybelea sp.]|nr:D-erythronate dehydrogenase [Candidatus Cybelea sp.]